MKPPLAPLLQDPTPDESVMVDRTEGLTSEPHVPRPVLHAPRQVGWLWFIATFCYFIIAFLPIFEHAKTSSALGPCALIVALGLALLIRRPFLWRAATLGVILVIAGSWFGWVFISSAQSAWNHLSTTDQTSALQETLRRAGWAAGASAGLGLWCKTSHSLAWTGALVGVSCSLAMMMGWGWLWLVP